MNRNKVLSCRKLLVAALLVSIVVVLVAVCLLLEQATRTNDYFGGLEGTGLAKTNAVVNTAIAQTATVK